MKAYLSEIFSSIQGEGPHVGDRHLFVRFCGCHRRCVYCDTPTAQTPACQIEKVPGSGRFETLANPLSVEQVADAVLELDAKRRNRHISITGGEPLLHTEFLRGLLPRLLDEGRSIYLETTGDQPDSLAQVLEWIDVVAMDLKLASVTHEPAAFSSHWKFLTLCRNAGVEVFVKLVLSAGTDEAELAQAAAGILHAGGSDMRVVLQPMTPSARTDAVPSGRQLLHWQETVAEKLPNTRVIPQTHLMMEML